MKSRPHPYFWKWKIKVQKIKLSVSGGCWKLKITMAQEMKTAVLSVCSKKTWNCKIKTSPENGQPHPFHPTQLLFWTLPEQLSILHHACVPTHPEPTSQDTLQTSDPKIFISHIPVLNFAGTTRKQMTPRNTTHVCQPWTNVPKIHHKTSDPKT